MYSNMKKAIRDALEENELARVVSLATENKKNLSQLIRHAYDKETLVAWRAIKAIGLAAKELVKTDYDFLREACRKLLWSLSDESGGIGWAAPEILGEIVSADPERFSDIIPLIAEVYGVEEQVFRPGVVYAISRIAETAPEKVVQYQQIIIDSLRDNNPLLQIYAIGLVEILWRFKNIEQFWSDEYRTGLMGAIDALKYNSGVAWIYQNNGFMCREVGEMALETCKKLVI